MSSRKGVEKERIVESGCPLANHSLNQRMISYGTQGGERMREEPLKVRRARKRRERIMLERELEQDRKLDMANQALLEERERQLDIFLAGALDAKEVVVATIESRSGFVHEIGVIYLKEI